MDGNIFKNLIVEYVNIVNFLMDEGKIYWLYDGNIGIERPVIDKLIEKHAYIKGRKKLKLWKTLNLLITEKDLYTDKKWIYKENKKVRMRVYVINIKTYYILKSILKVT